MLKKLALAGALALATGAVAAHEITLGDIEIIHPYVFETPPGAMAGGGFMTIANNGETADRLLAVEADYPKVQIHQSVVKDGVGQMLPVTAIDLPPGETVALEPGGYHIMFIGLGNNRFKAGEEIPATLVFEKAGKVEIDFKVVKRRAGMKMKMKQGDDDASQ